MDKSSHISPMFLNRQLTTSKNTTKKCSPRKTDPIANLLSKLTLIRGELHSRCQSVLPPQNGGHVSCFQPKTDKQVSYSDSDELTPGSRVRWVINVAYLLGTEMCVFFAPPPQKKMSTFQNENIHFSHLVSALHQHSFSFSQRTARLVAKGGYVTEKHLMLASYLHSFMWEFEMCWKRKHSWIVMATFMLCCK